MSKAGILAELTHLTANDLVEVQAKLDELVGDAWQNQGELSDADKSTLDRALTDYQENPTAGSWWAAVRARVLSKLPSDRCPYTVSLYALTPKWTSRTPPFGMKHSNEV